MAAGSPAKPIRKRFKPRVVEELLSIRWWDWDIEKITRNIPAIQSADIELLKNAK
jgi:virginiamycin A acetyltransferase